MQLTKNFSKEEFECRCGCGFNDINMELVNILQRMRIELNAAITINSACRCTKHNAEVGGKPSSQHLLGNAADIVVNGCTPAYVYQWLNNNYPDTYGIGKYKSFTHIDVRQRKARW